MSKFKDKTKDEIPAFQYPIYSPEELRVLEKELEDYKITKTITEKGKDVEITFYDETKWMQDNGGLGKNGGVILGNSLPIKYEILKNKLSQLYKKQSKREYAIKMQNIETDEAVRNLKVEDNRNLITLDEF